MTFPSALPVSRVGDSMEAPPLRWGILGPGSIADRFAAALTTRTRQTVQAVGSRTLGAATAFAERRGVPRAYGSYDALVADPDVDIVYVATPHNFHRPHALLALQAGKHVLVEKPMTLNVSEAREVAALARAKGLFAMEALWTLFLPKFDVLRQLLADGAVGDVRTVLADHGQYFEAGHRILRPDLAGGPMLDLMTYPASFAHWVIGAPTEVRALTTWVPSGVTGQTAIMYAAAGDRQALLHSSVLGPTPTTGSIGGSTGHLFLDGDFYTPGGFTLTSRTGRRLRYDEPPVGHEALHFQAAEAARRIDAGEVESPVRPLQATIETMAIMDEARRQIGERFAEEGASPEGPEESRS
ncbi:MAG TPA: Gfo/Idh/MocA family oxidoreductase [Candidatus Lustribacter sp.]|nr:Gfo/Idh/MocA family oxidoreductase [Candidatus Lustribacter sp.]